MWISAGHSGSFSALRVNGGRNAARDVDTLKRTPPTVIVFMVQDQGQVGDTEKVFRHGARSETRRIAETIADLTTGYNLLGTFKVPTQDRELQVWRRR